MSNRCAALSAETLRARKSVPCWEETLNGCVEILAAESWRGDIERETAGEATMSNAFSNGAAIARQRCE